MIKLATIALLLNECSAVNQNSAVRQKDLGELELPTLTDENDVAQDKKLVDQ